MTRGVLRRSASSSPLNLDAAFAIVASTFASPSSSPHSPVLAQEAPTLPTPPLPDSTGAAAATLSGEDDDPTPEATRYRDSGAEERSTRGVTMSPRSDWRAADAEEAFDAQGDESPLDTTLERIGMGAYQWRLLVLCGFGWACDNMWLQAIAVILPRVQVHFRVSDQWSGLPSTSIFAGMMLGAWTWGTCSDTYGRKLPFNATLVMAALAGFGAALAPTFRWLCLALACLGFGVGGSMPTDGTLFLENIPKSRHYLLTALSFFFSIGAVIASLLGLVTLPGASCSRTTAADALDCDVEVDNLGWRHMLAALSTITLCFCVARVLLFRLHESPKYLVAAGRDSEAVTVLRHISAYNERAFDVGLADVQDASSSPFSDVSSAKKPYAALAAGSEDDEVVSPGGHAAARGAPTRLRRSWSNGSGASMGKSGRAWRQAAEAGGGYLQRVTGLFTPQWARTTTLVWTIWATVSFGYTCFNVFLPKYLEEKMGSELANDGGLTASLQDYVVYTIAGCPGSLFGAYLIETRLGRRYSMALSALLTALGTWVFVGVSTQGGVVLCSAVISIMATLMYAVIYGYTPEVFAPSSRGTACGVASALSRLAGIIAPLLTGAMLEISTSLPLYVSVVAFLVSCGCMCALPIETRRAGRSRR